tara:strand:+ start:3265 stop:3561 length:297 start_codon:yes stop_codon:yes gene_type:complete
MIYYVEIIGYIGCILLFFSFFPQTLFVIRTNNYDKLSNNFLILNIITAIVLALYASLRNIYPIMVSNISVLLNNLIIYYLKCKYNKKKNIQQEIIEEL